MVWLSDKLGEGISKFPLALQATSCMGLKLETDLSAHKSKGVRELLGAVTRLLCSVCSGKFGGMSTVRFRFIHTLENVFPPMYPGDGVTWKDALSQT